MKETKKRIQLCIGLVTKDKSKIYINPEAISKKDLDWVRKNNDDPYVEKIKARD